MAGTLTTTQAACHIPEIWSADTIDAVEANIVIADQVQRKWEKELKVGDILNIGYISNPTASTKSANTNISLEVIGPSSAEASETITVNTHQYVAFGVENITQVQSKTNLRSKYTKKGGYALASAVDTNLATLPQNFSNSVGTLGIELTYDNLLRASQYLDDANAPESDRYIILNPAAKAGILKLEEFKSSDYVGPDTAGKAVRDAYVGKVLGAPTFNTTLIRAPSAGQGECFFCQKEGVALIMQDVKSRADYVIERDADVVLLTQIYGYTEVLIPPITAGGGAAVDTHNCLMNTIG
jgi:hypothetical protein